MRQSAKEFTVTENIQITKVASYEEIVSINEDKRGKVIEVQTHHKDNIGNVLGISLYTIEGTWYDLLISASPVFAPNKPLNEYRESDLFYIIDRMD